MERPISMCDLMVRALLDPDHPKTMTRRVAHQFSTSGLWTPVEYTNRAGNRVWGQQAGDVRELSNIRCPYGKVGDRLYVREAVRADRVPSCWSDLVIRYRADDSYRHVNFDEYDGWYTLPADKWRPAMFMPRWASRITLEITGIRVERVQDISFADCRAEGCDLAYEKYVPECTDPTCEGRHRGEKWHFMELWDHINAKRGYGWDVNPWCWVVEFKRVDAA